jgi:uncharacterized protein YndB with AHSA1/START domain
MNSIDLTTTFSVPPETVFAVLTDYAQLNRWRLVEAFRQEPEGPATVGTRIYTTVNAMGRSMEFGQQIDVLDPDSLTYRDHGIEGMFLIQNQWQIEPSPEGSVLRWTTELDASGLPSFVVGFILAAIQKGLKEDMARLQAVVIGY